jgi:hypothetical protein
MPRIRKSTSLKFAAVAIGVAGIVGLTISSAASLNLAGGSVGAGTSTITSCQPALPAPAISVTFTNAYSSSAPGPGYAVTKVTLGNVNAACAGQQVKVTLTDSAGVSLGEVTGVAATGTNVLTLSTPVLATSVVGTQVVIYN